MSNGRILVADIENVSILKFVGDVRVIMGAALENYFATLYQKSILDKVIVDKSARKMYLMANQSSCSENN